MLKLKPLGPAGLELPAVPSPGFVANIPLPVAGRKPLLALQPPKIPDDEKPKPLGALDFESLEPNIPDCAANKPPALLAFVPKPARENPLDAAVGLEKLKPLDPGFERLKPLDPGFERLKPLDPGFEKLKPLDGADLTVPTPTAGCVANMPLACEEETPLAANEEPLVLLKLAAAPNPLNWKPNLCGGFEAVSSASGCGSQLAGGSWSAMAALTCPRAKQCV
eukprot:SAG31_NODE_2904_length_4928_cov_3.585007_2_plen_222_part_00